MASYTLDLRLTAARDKILSEGWKPDAGKVEWFLRQKGIDVPKGVTVYSNGTVIFESDTPAETIEAIINDYAEDDLPSDIELAQKLSRLKEGYKDYKAGKTLTQGQRDWVLVTLVELALKGFRIDPDG